MKRKIRRGFMVATLLVAAAGIGMQGQTVWATETSTDEEVTDDGSLVTENGYWKYQYCQRLDGSVEVAILEYVGTVPDPIVPEEIDGYPVTAISAEAFSYNKTLTMVELPRTVLDIGTSAFVGCTNLTSVTIDASPNSANGNPEEGMEYQIGEGAFSGCTSLTKLQLPQGITQIYSLAFGGCSALETITIPDTVTEIGSSAFLRCEKLQKITLPNSVETLGFGAFSECRSLTSAVLSSSLILIDHHTFSNCTALESITIPASVMEIGNEAFEFCSNLKIAVIPPSVEKMGVLPFTNCHEDLTVYAEKDSYAMLFADNVNSNVQGIPVKSATDPVLFDSAGWKYMMHGADVEIVGYTGEALEIEIPEEIDGQPVTSVAGRIFTDSQITDFQLPPLVENIGDDICNGCTSLQSITLSNQLREIGDRAFKGCKSLESVVFFDELIKIGDGAFQDCVLLETVDFPPKVTYVGNEAFSGCVKLTEASFVEREETTEEIELGYGVFKKCDLKSFEVPSGVKSIGSSAFSDNQNMGTITLPEDITFIGDSAFSSCYKLKAIDLPDELTYIGDYAFSSCEILEEIEIPNQVETIDNRAFIYCPALKKATILSNVQTLGNDIFLESENVVIYTSAGSKAEAYAIKYEIPYVIIGQGLQPITPTPDPDPTPGTDPGDTTTTPPGGTTTTPPGGTTTTPPAGGTVMAPTTEAPAAQVTVPSVAKVGNFKAIAKKKAFVLSWKKAKGVSGYEIQVSTKKNFKGAKTNTIKKSKDKYTISKLKAKTKYYVRIRAYTNYTDGDKKVRKAYGKWTVITKKTK